MKLKMRRGMTNSKSNSKLAMQNCSGERSRAQNCQLCRSVQVNAAVCRTVQTVQNCVDERR